MPSMHLGIDSIWNALYSSRVLCAYVNERSLWKIGRDGLLLLQNWLYRLSVHRVSRLLIEGNIRTSCRSRWQLNDILVSSPLGLSAHSWDFLSQLPVSVGSSSSTSSMIAIVVVSSSSSRRAVLSRALFSVGRQSVCRQCVCERERMKV